MTNFKKNDQVENNGNAQVNSGAVEPQSGAQDGGGQPTSGSGTNSQPGKGEGQDNPEPTVKSPTEKLTEFLKDKHLGTEIHVSDIVGACGCKDDECVDVIRDLNMQLRKKFQFLGEDGKLLIKRRSFSEKEEPKAIEMLKSLFEEAKSSESNSVKLKDICELLQCDPGAGEAIFYKSCYALKVFVELDKVTGYEDKTKSDNAKFHDRGWSLGKKASDDSMDRAGVPLEHRPEVGANYYHEVDPKEEVIKIYYRRKIA
ncbi:hypothetical protein [Maridesulfovibrio salexigens]|uniref:Uncharacterized protein n=1 Tax=Maridesulfovibrio salexigens (strain ATCC 14822 / DSM 2638 / NCIMB 8403 / VKM B-1763) TaxID=526222 RepID=C6BRP1_MARSD|nr:hypothetical protein [Maridesulfovibrio salexigens]ACS79481.1 hypothetical protein Desal_1419 [Maridesulfovibrio salexigens DSM 2638]